MPKAPPKFEHVSGELDLMWQNMQTRSGWVSAIDRRAKQIIGHRATYMDVEASVGVPWWMVGVIHSMESGLNFSRHLHNGDSLQKRTWRVPKGRPRSGRPPFTWSASAEDALRMKGWHRVQDWTMPRVLYELERYNGFGYRMYHKQVKTPYLWSGTKYYSKGKYIADGKWSSTAVSGQTGCAPLLKRIFEISEQVHVPTSAPQVVPLPTRKPELTQPEPEPVHQPIEDIDPAPVPKAGPTDQDEPVKQATKESKTILGALIALLASIVQWFEEAAQTLLEAASEISTLAPAKGLLSSLGANTGSIAFGIAVFGIALVVFRRLDAAARGKVG